MGGTGTAKAKSAKTRSKSKLDSAGSVDNKKTKAVSATVTKRKRNDKPAAKAHSRVRNGSKSPKSEVERIYGWPRFFGKLLGGVVLLILGLVFGWRAFVLFSIPDGRVMTMVAAIVYLFTAVTSFLVGGLLAFQREVPSYWRGLFFLALAGLSGLMYYDASVYVDFIGFPMGQSTFLAICSMILATMLVVEVVACLVAAVLSFRKKPLPIFLIWIMILALTLSMILFSFWQFSDYRNASCFVQEDVAACESVDADLGAVVIIDLAIYTVGIVAGYLVAKNQKREYAST